MANGRLRIGQVGPGQYNLNAEHGAYALTGQAATLGSSIAEEFLVTDLVTGWDTLTYLAGSGAGTATWMTDETGGFVRLFWSAGGNRGLRWNAATTPPRTQLYVKFDLRRHNVNCNTKQLKIMSAGNNNNFTWGPQANGYEGGTGAGGLAYSDWPTGGDNLTVVRYDGTERGVFQRTPHPTQAIVTPNLTQAIGGWDTWEMYMKYNDNNVNNGIAAMRKNGVFVFHLTNMWNSANGNQSFGNIGFGEYINADNVPPEGATDDYRRVYISDQKPAWVP